MLIVSLARRKIKAITANVPPLTMGIYIDRANLYMQEEVYRKFRELMQKLIEILSKSSSAKESRFPLLYHPFF